MVKPLLRLKSSPRRPQVATPRFEALFNPYAQCTCDLDDSSFCPPEWYADVYDENGETSSHLRGCHQLGTLLPETNQKRESLGGPASYLVLEEEGETSKVDVRKKNARRQRKEAKRIRDAEARTAAMKAVNPALKPYAQCYCDLFSDSEEAAVRGEASTMRHTHTDGSINFHLPNCPTARLDYTTPRKHHISPPKSASYIDLEEEEETTEVQKKGNHTRRQPPKSAAYIDSEEEEEEGGDGSVSPLAKRYDRRTIASDILRAIGEHPDLPPLNALMEGFPAKMKARASR